MEIPSDPRSRALRVAAAAEEARALEVSILEVGERLALCEYFVLCHSRSPLHGEAIVEKVEERMSEGGSHPRHREGGKQGEWIVLDYGDVVLHVFSERARQFYSLERLWSEVPRLSPQPTPPSGGGP